MSYQVLARKWRPKSFAEVIGQEHVVRALQGALNQKRLHHAYLFSGTRGVGKTTIARILAKCFSCETGTPAEPCGKCDACIEIDNGRFIDLIEVDAASRTKVEDTRDLLNNAQYLPTKGPYKIYIIDEVHMLSGHSFNALLKTLEEPPAHVKFLLATTDPQKLPVTVLSRCLQFNLKALNPELIQKQLQHILTQEKIPYEDLALHQLAFDAKGSVRDALSLLDQAIAFGQNKITVADVKAMLGTIDTRRVFALLEELINNNPQRILEVIAELAELATDFASTTDELLEILHQISLVQFVPNIDTSNWQYPELTLKLANQITPEITQIYYQIALLGKRDLQLAPSLKSGFEMMMLRMVAFRPEVVAPLPLDLDRKSFNKKEPDLSARSCNKENTPRNNVQVQVKNATQDDEPVKDDELVKIDHTILQKLELTGITKTLMQYCLVDKITDSGIELMVEPSQAVLINKKHEELISEALSKYSAKRMSVSLRIGPPEMQSPAKIKQQETLKKQNEARQALEQDEFIKEFINKFDAKVIANSPVNKEN